jgi:hypothetical protein
MCPRTLRALVTWVFTTALALTPAVALAAEDTFALPTTDTTSMPFDLVSREVPTASLTRHVIETPPFDFPEPEQVASCRGCRLSDRFEPPPFTL